MYKRTINIAINKVTGELFDAVKAFDNSDDRFLERKKYHEGRLELICCECRQDLVVSSSKFKRIYLRHKPKYGECFLSNKDINEVEYQNITNIFKSKESDRHKELKNKIGLLLRGVSGIDVDSINVDNKFIIRGSERRKPDVYCKFRDKEIVFEIQLSALSPKYIIERYKFYKANGMYLIWILDNLDIKNQQTLNLDIKYLSKHENYFKLDESSENLKLECYYKVPYLTNDDMIHTNWKIKSVSLGQLNYDKNDFQVYYYNFGLKKEQKSIELQRIEEQKIMDSKCIIAELKAKSIIDEVSRIRKTKWQIYDHVLESIKELNDFEIRILNKELNIGGKTFNGKPPLILWIDNSFENDSYFLQFLITTKEIELDINATDNTGRTPLQAIIQNKYISKSISILALLEAGYKLTYNDKKVILKQLENETISEDEYYMFMTFNRLGDRSLVPEAVKASKLIFIIESARIKKLASFNFKGNKWISFANNAITNYANNWIYIERAFKYYGVWDTIIQADRKKSFQKKVKEFYSNRPDQTNIYHDILDSLYPELKNSIE